MRLRRPQGRRRGATVVEAAVIITAFLMLILGTIDLGTAVFRYHVLSWAARQGARRTIVHGTLAPTGNGGPWGPPASYPTTNPYTVTASNTSDPIANAIRPSLVGLDPSAVTITVTWPDGSDAVEKRVQVTLNTTWHPLMLFIFGNQTINLSASSEMPIAH
jgi:Flp pilus assembly protein TadG